MISSYASREREHRCDSLCRAWRFRCSPSRSPACSSLIPFWRDRIRIRSDNGSGVEHRSNNNLMKNGTITNSTQSRIEELRYHFSSRVWVSVMMIKQIEKVISTWSDIFLFKFEANLVAFEVKFRAENDLWGWLGLEAEYCAWLWQSKSRSSSSSAIWALASISRLSSSSAGFWSCKSWDWRF